MIFPFLYASVTNQGAIVRDCSANKEAGIAKRDWLEDDDFLDIVTRVVGLLMS